MPDLALPDPAGPDLAPALAAPEPAHADDRPGASDGLDAGTVSFLAEAHQGGLQMLYGDGWPEAGARLERAFAAEGAAAYRRLEADPGAYGAVANPDVRTAEVAGGLWAREYALAEARGETLPGSYHDHEARGAAIAGQEHERAGGWAREQDRAQAQRIDAGLVRRAERLYEDATALRDRLGQTPDARRAANLSERLADVEAQRDEVGAARRELAELGASERAFRFERLERGESIANSSPEDGVFVIRHDGTLGNQVHEITHAYQYASGVTSFPTPGRVSVHGGVSAIDTEVEAYRRQFAFDPDSLPRTSDQHPDRLSEVTADYVRGIYQYDTVGLKNYYYRAGGY